MGLLDYFRATQPPGSATVAKERLQILVAHDRAAARGCPSYLPQLQTEILAVIRKYIDVDMNSVTVNYEQGESHEVLELNIILPDSPSSR
ncbi:cell division topological specificity factor MinE [Chromatium okenii]|uniref:cell division topological specificity factor MinE n=1 Tax=Chromatium okenii TaxID=61644 RepID=UPI0019064D9C|nr:cell division topological specificity factor MinE [Chromatium okenii]MBK1640779.1 cell division topological specificity factor MinE [Chromatium okenii]